MKVGNLLVNCFTVRVYTLHYFLLGYIWVLKGLKGWYYHPVQVGPFAVGMTSYLWIETMSLLCENTILK